MGTQTSKEHHNHASLNANGKFGPNAILYPSQQPHPSSLSALSISSPLPVSAFAFPPGATDQSLLPHQFQLNSQHGSKASSKQQHIHNRHNFYPFPSADTNGKKTDILVASNRSLTLITFQMQCCSNYLFLFD